MADSCWGLTENRKILWSNYPYVKNKVIKKIKCTSQIVYLLSVVWNLTQCTSQVKAVIKNLPANAGDVRDIVWSLGWEDPLEEGMATHSSILSWRIPWTEEPGGPQFMGSQESDTTEATAPYTILFVICTYHYHYFLNILHIGNMQSEIFNQDCQQWQYSLNDTFLYLDPPKLIMHLFSYEFTLRT